MLMQVVAENFIIGEAGHLSSRRAVGELWSGMSRMRDAGCGMQDARYWILDTGYWILDTGYKIHDRIYWKSKTPRIINS
jgi:hypothetical protein